MKKFIMLLALVASTAFAEPSFNQIQDLIGRQQYSSAEQGLEQIIKNHPNSAKAYYSMAQAQAGMGNLDKARYALDKATGLDPTLSFASQSQVQSLREAITPQVKKIEVVEETHYFRNFLLAVLLIGFGYAVYAYFKRRRDDEGEKVATPIQPVDPSPSDKAYMKEHNLTATSDERKMEVPPRGKETTVKYTAPTYSYTPPAPAPVQPIHTTTVVNQSNDGLLTGMLIGNMLSNNHHDTIIEREVVHEVPSRTLESSSNRSSSWDSDSSSSSWDSDSSSSSSSSSSWDSSSSSSSSWDSSSSSDSSWDSSSSSSSSDW